MVKFFKRANIQKILDYQEIEKKLMTDFIFLSRPPSTPSTTENCVNVAKFSPHFAPN